MAAEVHPRSITRGAQQAVEQLPPSAGVCRRAAATLVDMLLFVGLTVLLVYPVLGAIDWTRASTSYDDMIDAVSDRSFVSHASGMIGLWTASWWCYFVVGWGAAGATPGKWLLGLRLIDHQGRYPIGMSRAALRLVAYMVSSLTLGTGHMLMVFRLDRRALHDILAGTRVVRRRAALMYKVRPSVRARGEPGPSDQAEGDRIGSHEPSGANDDRA